MFFMLPTAFDPDTGMIPITGSKYGRILARWAFWEDSWWLQHHVEEFGLRFPEWTDDFPLSSQAHLESFHNDHGTIAMNGAYAVMPTQRLGAKELGVFFPVADGLIREYFFPPDKTTVVRADWSHNFMAESSLGWVKIICRDYWGFTPDTEWCYNAHRRVINQLCLWEIATMLARCFALSDHEQMVYRFSVE